MGEYIFFIFAMAGLMCLAAGLLWLIFSLPEEEDGPEFPEDPEPIITVGPVGRR